MKIHIIDGTGPEDAWGPYTNQELLARSLEIIRMALDDLAEVVTKECDPWAEQILAGLLPYRIHVDIVGGEPQLPAEVSITWPPAEQEGIQEGTPEYTDYFVWAKNEKAALWRLARLNRAAAAPRATEAEA